MVWKLKVNIYFATCALLFAADSAIGSNSSSDASVRDPLCEAAARSLALGTKKAKIDQVNTCFRHTRENSKRDRRLYSSAPGKVPTRVFARANMIYVQRGPSFSVIAGEMTGLNSIESVVVSPDGKTIAALDSFKTAEGTVKKQILFFESSLNGNVVPFRLNSEELVNHARAIAFLADDELMMSVLEVEPGESKEKPKIVSFKLKGDSRSPVAKNKPSHTILIDSKSTPALVNPISLTRKEGGDLIVFDAANGIQVFKYDNKDYRLETTIASSDSNLASLQNVTHISYNAEKKVLSIFDESGASSKIQY